jgi:RIO kinase 1
MQERKKAVKEEQRERRQNKMPKSEKARLIKKASNRR